MSNVHKFCKTAKVFTKGTFLLVLIVVLLAVLNYTQWNHSTLDETGAEAGTRAEIIRRKGPKKPKYANEIQKYKNFKYENKGTAKHDKYNSDKKGDNDQKKTGVMNVDKGIDRKNDNKENTFWGFKNDGKLANIYGSKFDKYRADIKKDKGKIYTLDEDKHDKKNKYENKDYKDNGKKDEKKKGGGKGSSREKDEEDSPEEEEDSPEDEEDSHEHEEDEEDADLRTGPYHWNGAYQNNPCFIKGGKLTCGPQMFVMGIQHAGLNMLVNAINLHPDIDCYSTRFFSGFDDMEDITRSDMEMYFSNFEASTNKIAGGANDLSICDVGRDLARTYDLGSRHQQISEPHHTTASALAHMYNGIKVIILLRDPTIRFYREFCFRNTIETFEDYVDAAIADFEDCEADDAQRDASCVYNDGLSPILQAGLYDYLIDKDIGENIPSGSVILLNLDRLKNPYTRTATMTNLFSFLGKAIPDSGDAYWDNLDAVFNTVGGGDYCERQPIPRAAKQKLDAFYSTRATVYFNV